MKVKKARKLTKIHKINKKVLKEKRRRNRIKGVNTMATVINNTNIYEFEVKTGKLAELKEKLEKPSMTKEFADECKRIAEIFRRNGLK